MHKLCLIVLLCLLPSCRPSLQKELQVRIEGVALEGPAQQPSSSVMYELVDIGANQVCLMPYSFIREGESKLQYDLGDRHMWWGEQTQGIVQMTKDAQAAGLEVMLKPHLWIGHGAYT